MAETNEELADFLRRARASREPSLTALPHDGRTRRVPGLRREEVAVLAGISTDYYTRLEQGRRILPSPSVLSAVSRALGLDGAASAHLLHLVGASAAPRERTVPVVQRVRPGLRQVLDAMDGQPALVLGRRTEVLASNALARALFADFEAMRPRERGYVRWMLLSPEARALFEDWPVQARSAVESLRFDAGQHPDDPALDDLVQDLSARSEDFRRWWSEHHVHQRSHGSKRLRHPLVGSLTVDYETLTLPGDADQSVFVYTTPAGSPSRQALDLLASWTQTVRPVVTSRGVGAS